MIYDYGQPHCGWKKASRQNVGMVGRLVDRVYQSIILASL